MSRMITYMSRLLTAALAASVLALAGCATQGYGQAPPSGNAYGTTYQSSRGNRACPRNQCGVVRQVGQIYVRDNNKTHVLGTIIGAVVGGALGNTVGKGDGRRAATVVGAVAGGAVGNQVAKRNSPDTSPAWRVVVKLNDGRIATVTQRGNPQVRRGDYVRIRNGHVYRTN
jgi:outer membrane lipoprotein SlyB